MFIRSIVMALIILIVLLVPARADHPDPADAWTEYASALDAQADGWFTECGLSQLLVVDADCVCGAVSVACRAQQARWQNRFGLRTAAPLTNVTTVAFDHYATWTGLDVIPWNLFLVMEATPAEIAAGYDSKRIHWTFPKAETWTRTELAIVDGTWAWHDASSGMWQPNAPEGSTELTTLIGLEWYLNTFMGIAIGDMMRIDDLVLVTDATSVEPGDGDDDAAMMLWPNPTTGSVSMACHVPHAAPGRLVVYDARGRRVRTLADGWIAPDSLPTLWDGRDDQRVRVAAGNYRVVLEIGASSVCRPVTLVR